MQTLAFDELLTYEVLNPIERSIVLAFGHIIPFHPNPISGLVLDAPYEADGASSMLE